MTANTVMERVLRIVPLFGKGLLLTVSIWELTQVGTKHYSQWFLTTVHLQNGC